MSIHQLLYYVPLFTPTVFSTEGEIVNDTIIGDPLFTVTLPQGNEFMCYEVHGQAGKYFNLISDTCTSVNALFTALTETLNRMSEIGIYAVDSANECVQIQVNLAGCSGSVDGETLPLISGQPNQYQQNGISVRRYPTRWRVTVPNCGTTQLVMWMICDQSREMLDFRIARGNNLAPTSHGLLGNNFTVILPTLPVCHIKLKLKLMYCPLSTQPNAMYICSNQYEYFPLYL